MPTKLSQLPAADPATAAAGVALWTGKDAISGLRMERTAANALRVTPGCAVIESLGYLVTLATAITKTGLVLSANTWYHVYLYLNSGVPDIEIVTTAPAAPYFGTARSKTSDTSRRYLGSIRTTAAANTIVPFYHVPASNSIKYLQDLNTAPMSILSNGVAVSNTTVSAANTVPVTARVLYAFAENRSTDPAANAHISNPDVGPASPTNILYFLRTGSFILGEIALDSSQQFNYYRQVTADGGLSVWSSGYVYER